MADRDEDVMRSKIGEVARAVIRAATTEGIGGTAAEILAGIAMALATSGQTFGDAPSVTRARLAAAQEIVEMRLEQERKAAAIAAAGGN